MPQKVHRNHLMGTDQPWQELLPPGFHGSGESVEQKEGLAGALDSNMEAEAVPQRHEHGKSP
jgi:hypothetical protein